MREVLGSGSQNYVDDLLKPYRHFARKERKKAIDSKKLAADATV